MRSKFKYSPLSKQTLFKVAHFNKLIFNKGGIPCSPLVNIVDSKKVNILVHNGKKNNRLRASNFRLLVNENFFFIRKLRVGNFRFTKKQCVFKKKLRKKK